MKAEFTGICNTINGVPTTCGFRSVRLGVPGVDWRKLAAESTLPVAVSVNTSPLDYCPSIPIEFYERGHCFRLADRLGKILAQN